MKDDLKAKFKNIFAYISFFIIFTIVVIIGIIYYNEHKTFKVNKAVKSLSSIDNCLINLKLSKSIESEDGKDTINVLYKTLLDKNYNNKGILALDGDFGLEVESMKLGIYLPIQLILDEDIKFSTEVDEVYQTIIEIPENNTQLHANLKPILNSFDNDYKDFDINTLFKYLEIITKVYFDNNKNEFNYISEDEQFYMFTGAVGRFNKNISKRDFDELRALSSVNEALDKNPIYSDLILKFIDKIEDDYTLYIYVSNSQIYKIELFNDEVNLTVNLKNINYDNELSFPEDYDNYGLDFNDYLDRSKFNWLSLFGLNEDGSANLKVTLQKHFKELMSYMYLCMEYSEAGDNKSAQQYIELMSTLISTIEETPNISETDKEAFNNYIEVYKLLMRYTVIYNQQCLSIDESVIKDLDSQLFDTLKQLSDKLNSLGINIQEAFEDTGDTTTEVGTTEEVIDNEISTDEQSSTEVISQEDKKDIIEKIDQAIPVITPVVE